MKRRITSLLLGSLALAAHADDTPTKPVRVGFICPFSGGSQDFGNSARLGAELAVKEINEVGGYLGRRIELVARDDKADPDEGRKIPRSWCSKRRSTSRSASAIPGSR